jgi:hypothetical protein
MNGVMYVIEHSALGKNRKVYVGRRTDRPYANAFAQEVASHKCAIAPTNPLGVRNLGR